MLRTNGRRANPLRVRSKFNASLEHNVYHVVSARVMRADIDAAILPRFEHLITAVPIFEKHHAVMGCSIELSYLFFAEFDALVLSAHLGMVLMRSG